MQGDRRVFRSRHRRDPEMHPVARVGVRLGIDAPDPAEARRDVAIARDREDRVDTLGQGAGVIDVSVLLGIGTDDVRDPFQRPRRVVGVARRRRIVRARRRADAVVGRARPRLGPAAVRLPEIGQRGVRLFVRVVKTCRGRAAVDDRPEDVHRLPVRDRDDVLIVRVGDRQF